MGSLLIFPVEKHAHTHFRLNINI